MKQNMQMEQHLNYILMIKNQNILATLMIFLSQLKALMKSFIQKRQTSKTAIPELFNFFVRQTFL